MRFIAIILFVAGCTLGYIIGTKMGKKGPLQPSSVVVRELPATNITFASPTPVKVVYLPPDTVTIPVEIIKEYNIIDTVALVKDYMAKRSYEFINADSSSNDTVRFNVQHNRVYDFNWVRHGLVYEQTFIKPQNLSFFGVIGGDSRGILSIGAGLYFKDYGASLGFDAQKAMSIKFYYRF
jgi:hypothetical protein